MAKDCSAEEVGCKEQLLALHRELNDMRFLLQALGERMADLIEAWPRLPEDERLARLQRLHDEAPAPSDRDQALTALHVLTPGLTMALEAGWIEGPPNMIADLHRGLGLAKAAVFGVGK